MRNSLGCSRPKKMRRRKLNRKSQSAGNHADFLVDAEHAQTLRPSLPRPKRSTMHFPAQIDTLRSVLNNCDGRPLDKDRRLAILQVTYRCAKNSKVLVGVRSTSECAPALDSSCRSHVYRSFQVCGSTLAVFADESRPKAELRVELIASTLLESSSQGKLRSMKDEIFRWKVTIAGITSANLGTESVVEGGAPSAP